MIKKMTALVAIAGVAGVAAVTIAQASPTKSHSITQTGEGNGIGHPPFNGSGEPWSENTFAATLGSDAALIEKQTFKTSSATTFLGTVTVFEARGTFSGTITAGTVFGAGGAGPPSGDNVKVKITGGTGLYKGATGTATITHTFISGSPGLDMVKLQAKIKY
jgi:hypothetical protein